MVDDSEHFINTLQLEAQNDTFTADIRFTTPGVKVTTGADVIVTDRTQMDLISDSISSDTDLNATVSVLSNASSNIITNLQKHVTDSIDITNYSHIPDVIIKPEVQDDDFGTAEKVLIGTAVIIGSLTILSVVLRIIVPLCRRKIFKYKGSDVSELKPGLEHVESKLSGYSNLGIDELSFHLTGNGSTHSSGSTPSTDWTDVSSDQKQYEDQSDGFDINMAPTYNIQRPVYSEPLYMVDSGLTKSETSSSLAPKQPEEAMSIISTHSLEPLKMEHLYRSRWDDHKEQDIPIHRGAMSLLSFPSDSCLSLTSHSSHSSGSGSRTSSNVPSGSYACPSTSSVVPESCHVLPGTGTLEFPIPSKEMVYKLHQEKDRRYPSNTKIAPTIRIEIS